MMEFERELFESQTWVTVVVRLKANKYYQELLRYLSSYINLLIIKPSWSAPGPRLVPNL